MERIQKKLLIIALIFIAGAEAKAQIYLRTEYITPSSLKDGDHEVNGKSDLQTIDFGANIPLSIKMDESNRPTSWSIVAGSTYASLNNKNQAKDYAVSEILNAQIGVMHVRPISAKWSIAAVLGVGVFTSDLNNISGRAILAQGGILFVKQQKPNFAWGAGVALNNALGYPMIFPSLYLDWQLNGRFEFNLSMYDSFNLSLGTKINEHFKLSLIGESNGLAAAVKREGKSQFFIAQYGYVGLQPEFKIGKSISIPVTAGVSFSRDVYFQKRTMKAFLEDKEDYPYFKTSAYFATGIKYGF